MTPDELFGDPSFVAHSDQMTAKCRDIIADLMRLTDGAAQQFKETGSLPDPDEYMARVVEVLQRLEDPVETTGLIMYMVRMMMNLIRAGARTNAVALSMLRASALLLPSGHPLAVLAEGDAHKDLDAMVQAGLLDADGQTESYTTGTGQHLGGVHPAEQCEDDFCVIHNPVPGPWNAWPTNWRGDGPFDIWRGFERICPCGVGHPAMEELLRGNDQIQHGCCGCPCGPWACDEMRGPGGKLLGFMAKRQ